MALCVGGRWQHGRLNLKKKKLYKKDGGHGPNM